MSSRSSLCLSRNQKSSFGKLKDVPTEAGTTVMIAIASASATVILFNIAILLVPKPEAASADQIASRGAYSASPRNLMLTSRSSRVRV
jgi:hypothetical protein